MNKEEAIEILKNFNDGYTFQQCQTCFKFNEKDSYCNKEKCEELQAIDTVLNYIEEVEHKYNKALDTIIKYEKTLENLQKETIWKQKVRDKIEELNNEFKERTQDNDSFYFDYSNEYAHIEEVLKELLESEN